MSFADRLKKFTALGLSAGAPRGSIELCHPQVLMMRGVAMGLLHIELAPLVVGGAESLRILEALVDLFGERPSPEEHAREIIEAIAHLRQHLKSVSAAAELALKEHNALKQSDRGTLQ